MEHHLEHVTVDVDRLLPTRKTSYRYDGSLTTPHCSRGNEVDHHDRSRSTFRAADQRFPECDERQQPPRTAAQCAQGGDGPDRGNQMGRNMAKD